MLMNDRRNHTYFRKRILSRITIFIFVIIIVCFGAPFSLPLSSPPPESGTGHYYINVYGKKIHYVMEGKGPIIILLHAGGTSWHDWENIIPVLSKSYTVIAPDMPGAGSSEELDGAHTIESYEIFLSEFLETLSLSDTKVNIMGMSFGGMTALKFSLDHQTQIEKLVLLEVASEYTHPERRPILYTMNFFAQYDLTRETSKWWIYHLAQIGLFQSFDFEAGPDFVRTSSRASIEILVSWSNMKISTSELNKLEIPILLLVGSEDKEIPPVSVMQLASDLPNSKLVIVDGFNHANFGKMNLGTGGVVDKAILNFLSTKNSE